MGNVKIGLNRKVVEILVSDKTFKIGLFPILCESLIVKHDSLEKEYEKIEEPTSDDLNEKKETQYELQFKILESLLIANGYKFDRDWWELHSDALGITEFIIVAKSKDIVPNPKKKEAIKSH